MAFTDMIDSTMLTRVRGMINEPVALNFTDAELTVFLDRGANLICSMTKGVEHIASEVLVASQETYAYSDIFTAATDNIHVEAVFYTNAASGDTAQAGWCLRKAHPRELLTSPFAATDAPKWWFERNNTIGIHPVPEATGNAAAGNYIICLYYRNYDTFDDASTASYLPEYLQDVVTWYVLAQVNEKLKRYAVANYFMSIFMNFLMFYRADNYPTLVDSMDMMRAPDYTQFQ